jgi:hypothetical protein
MDLQSNIINGEEFVSHYSEIKQTGLFYDAIKAYLCT